MMNNSRFFCNSECEYFPCHKTDSPEDFNCLFCYCPLYSMGENCGGNFTYIDNKIKDCSQCEIPHSTKNYDYIIKKLSEIINGD
ncbi:MAG: cysteine-rich small domain-containing protein [Oscillospiraceae bacterium]|nr:cysteine-rich small domain-containing protein [Oscillospiraceae bacterium]